MLAELQTIYWFLSEFSFIRPKWFSSALIYLPVLIGTRVPMNGVIYSLGIFLSHPHNTGTNCRGIFHPRWRGVSLRSVPWCSILFSLATPSRDLARYQSRDHVAMPSSSRWSRDDFVRKLITCCIREKNDDVMVCWRIDHVTRWRRFGLPAAKQRRTSFDFASRDAYPGHVMRIRVTWCASGSRSAYPRHVMRILVAWCVSASRDAYPRHNAYPLHVMRIRVTWCVTS